MAYFVSCQAQNDIGDQDRSGLRDKPVSLGTAVKHIDHKITFIFQDTRRRYWFATDQGVYRYTEPKLGTSESDIWLFTLADGLCSYSILGIQEDHEGHIYFDTKDGVCRFDGERFDHLKVVDVDPFPDQWKSSPNDLWFRAGWDNNGPFRYDGDSLYALEFPNTDKADEFYAKFPNASYSPYGIYTMYKDQGGRMWFGTASLGVCRYDPEAFARGEHSLSWLYEKHLTETPSGGDFGIRSIIEDNDGYFWFCNSRYRYKIQSTKNDKISKGQISYDREKGVGAIQDGTEAYYPYFMSISEDNNGDLWMVTFDEGVWRSDGQELAHYPVLEDGEQVSLFSIYKDNYGILWLISHDEGLYRYYGEAFVKFKL